MDGPRPRVAQASDDNLYRAWTRALRKAGLRHQFLLDAVAAVTEGSLGVPENLVRHQDVLLDRHGILEQLMYSDHVHTGEVHPTLEPLHCYLADVRDELDRQIACLTAGIAVAHAKRHHALLLDVKGSVHRQRLRGGNFRQGGFPAIGCWDVEEGGVALELHEPHPVGGLGHGLQKTARDLLRVREAQSMRPHETRIAADVAGEQEGPPGLAVQPSLHVRRRYERRQCAAEELATPVKAHAARGRSSSSCRGKVCTTVGARVRLAPSALAASLRG